MTERLAAEGGVLVSPGEFYGPAAAGHVRLAMVAPWSASTWSPSASVSERPSRPAVPGRPVASDVAHGRPASPDQRAVGAARTELGPADADAAATVHEAIDLLDRGEARVAEIGADGEVIVHEWLKQAILLLFRVSAMETVEARPVRVRRQAAAEARLRGRGRPGRARARRPAGAATSSPASS